jgi:hypothetical protein
LTFRRRRSGRPTAATPGDGCVDARDPSRLVGAAVHGERDRHFAVGREVGAQRVVDLPGAGGGGQLLRVDGGEPDSGEREAEGRSAALLPPRFSPAAPSVPHGVSADGVWYRLARLVTRGPARIAVAETAR